MALSIAIITCSDTRSIEEDTAGRRLEELIRANGWDVASHVIVKDEAAQIGAAIIAAADELKADVVLTCGGSGLSLRDVTPETTLSVCDREVPGIGEAMRAYSMTKTGRAMLSRATAGQRGRCLVVNLPGSKKAAEENFEAVYEQFEHAVHMMAGEGHK